ncbi:hypothetical protein [Actinoallomurus sp. NPDC050550]|uniref:hypothetical protein n=1 Tax=Actinoallomurus sp. NPDC050550 TaxID=3154937 RepID=UPI003406645B
MNPPAARQGCAPWNLKCQLGSAIDTWFTGLAMMAIPPVMDLFGKTLLTTPELDSPPMARARSLWTASETIADTCFVVLVVIGGLLLMSGNAVAPETAAKDIVPRLLLAFVAANCSRLLVEQAIRFANGLARAFIDYGTANADPHGAAKLMEGWLVDNVTTLGMLSGLVTLVAVVLALFVVCGYIMRVTVTMLLVIAAPLALICHALPQTDGLARLWWRALTGMLAIQVAQSLVFATAVVVLSAKDGDKLPLAGFPDQKGIVDLLLVVCLLYILARIPSWVSKAIWRGALGRNPIAAAARTAFSILILRRITGGISGRTGGSRPSVPPPASVPPPGRPPGPPPPSPRPLPRPGPWVQPELPLQWPSPRGRQLELPNMPRLRPTPRRGIQLQLPLRPGEEVPRHWRQGELPIEQHAEQLRLPLNLPKRPVQPPLFTDFDRGRRPRPRIQDFPPRGSAPSEGRQPPPLFGRQRPRGDHR